MPKPGTQAAQTARTLYGSAFDPRDVDSYSAAMADWEDLSPAERSYIQAHLGYLTLMGLRDVAQRTTQASQKVTQAIGEAIDALQEEGEGDEEEGDDEPAPEFHDEAELDPGDETDAPSKLPPERASAAPPEHDSAPPPQNAETEGPLTPEVIFKTRKAS